MLLFWKRGPEVWCWMLRAWTPPVRGLSASLHPEAGCAAPTGPGCTDPLWTERSRTEPNRTELSRTAQRSPSVPSSLSPGRRLSYQPGLCSRVSVWMEAPGGRRLRIGPLLVLMLCCSAAPGHAERVSEHTRTHSHTHTRAHTHAHSHRWSGDGSDAFIDAWMVSL